MTLSMAWPLALVVLSNVFYQIFCKFAPSEISPFVSLSITYGLAMIVCLILFFVTTKETSLIKEVSQINWATIGLSVSIVGLEVGYIFAYKAGWPVSTMATVQGAFLAIILVFVGYLFFKESITISKLVGIAACLFGLYFLNK